jgi:hypothetical protein
MKFSSLLAVAFIVLKLTKVINWSWIWVLCPLWIGWVIAIAVLLMAWFAILLTMKD